MRTAGGDGISVAQPRKRVAKPAKRGSLRLLSLQRDAKKRPDSDTSTRPALKSFLRAYLDVPMLAGGGAGFAIYAAGRKHQWLRATAAKATVAAILTNFTMISPPFVSKLLAGLCQITAN